MTKSFSRTRLVLTYPSDKPAEELSASLGGQFGCEVILATCCRVPAIYQQLFIWIVTTYSYIEVISPKDAAVAMAPIIATNQQSQ